MVASASAIRTRPRIPTEGTPGFIDSTADLSVPKYYYRVTAVNAQGEGLVSNEIELPIVVPVIQDPCLVPGVSLAVDATGDGTLPGADLISLNVAEPQDLDGKLLFQIKADAPASAAPGTMFAVLFHTPSQELSNPDDAFVGMVMGPSGPQYVYGTRNEDAAVIVGYQIYTVLGTIDAASGISDDGTISRWCRARRWACPRAIASA